MALLALHGLPAHAQDAGSSSWPGSSIGDDGWQFRVAPNIWGAGLSGDSRIGASGAASIDASFSDVTKVLDIGFMSALEARKGRWGIVGDIFYVKLSTESQPLDNDLGRLDAEVTNTMYHLGVAYRVAEGPLGYVDAMAGLRYTDVDETFKLPVSTTYPDGARLDAGDDWVDGFVGLRGLYRFNDRWGMHGSFDVGSGGDHTSWQAMAGVEYVISHTTQVEFGYRYLAQNYQTPAFAYDMATAGAFVGLSFWF